MLREVLRAIFISLFAFFDRRLTSTDSWLKGHHP